MKTFAPVPPLSPPAAPEPEVPAFERFRLVLAKRVTPLEPRPETLAVLKEASSLRLLPPRGLLLRPGEPAGHVVLVLRGLLRSFEVLGAPDSVGKQKHGGSGPSVSQGTGQGIRQGSGKATGQDTGGTGAPWPGMGRSKAKARLRGAGKGQDRTGMLERTRGIFEGGELVADMSALLSGQSSGLGLQAVEEVAVLRLPWAALRMACNTDHAVERFCRLLAEEALLGAQRSASANALGGVAGHQGELPPEVCYRALLEERPALVQRLPAWLVASYLGISPEALTQLKARRLAIRRA